MSRPKDIPDLDDGWQRWLTKANTLFITGARLAEQTERDGAVLGTYAEIALLMYQSLTERHTDAELRQLLDSEEMS